MKMKFLFVFIALANAASIESGKDERMELVCVREKWANLCATSQVRGGNPIVFRARLTWIYYFQLSTIDMFQ